MNAWLRLTEKRHLSREADVAKLRQSFERKARLSFRSPGAARYEHEVIAGLSCTRVVGETGPLLLYFHGGAYIMGSPRTHRAMVAWLCKWAQTTALMPDYSKAPERPFPAAVNDAMGVYQELLNSGQAADEIVLGGDSAGGGLALALLGEICRRQLPMPKGLFAFSPLTDLTFSAPAIEENGQADVVLPVNRLKDQEAQYLNGADPRDPRASPMFAEFTGACPVWLAVGDTEILRDDSVLLAERMRAQGVDVVLTVEHDLPHVWPLFYGYFREAKRTIKDLAGWINSL